MRAGVVGHSGLADLARPVLVMPEGQLPERGQHGIPQLREQPLAEQPVVGRLLARGFREHIVGIPSAAQ